MTPIDVAEAGPGEPAQIGDEPRGVRPEFVLLGRMLYAIDDQTHRRMIAEALLAEACFRIPPSHAGSD